MSAPNFRVTVGLENLVRRDYPMYVPGLLSPFDAKPLTEGEWLELDSSKRLIRGTGEGVKLLQFPVHTEKGRYDTQALGKANVIYLGQYEFITKVFDATSLSAGDQLTVQDVSPTGLTAAIRGLKKSSSSGKAGMGYCSRVISTTEIEVVRFGSFVTV